MGGEFIRLAPGKRESVERPAETVGIGFGKTSAEDELRFFFHESFQLIDRPAAVFRGLFRIGAGIVNDDIGFPDAGLVVEMRDILFFEGPFLEDFPAAALEKSSYEFRFIMAGLAGVGENVELLGGHGSRMNRFLS
jgi:hypothetical protein